MRRTPLPAELGPGPFTVAQALARAVSRNRLRRADVGRVAHGLCVVGDPGEPDARPRLMRAALPTQMAYSHITAARLWGLPVPGCVPAERGLDVMTTAARGPVSRKGVIPYAGLEAREVTTRHGVPVTALADTWCDLVATARRWGFDQDDLVVLGDAVVRMLDVTAEQEGAPGEFWGREAAGPSSGLAQLGARVARRSGFHGVTLMREVLPMVRAGVRSPMETRSRLALVRGGLPEPEVNVDVLTDEGHWMLMGDLVWREQRVIGEYQGEHHATRVQRSLDGQRREMARDEGWTLIEIFAEDLFDTARRRSMVLRFAKVLGVPEGDVRLAA